MPGLLALVGCDQGDPEFDPVRGPPLGLVATFPADGAGTDCLPGAPEECGVPVNTTLELRFDRLLDPATAVRQSLRLYTGERGNQPASSGGGVLTPTYDLVERVVRYRLPPGETLAPRTLYTVELPVPDADQPYGFRAFDGALIAASRLPLRFSFLTSAVAEPEEPEAAVPSCSEILTIFSTNLGQAGCSGCHGDTAPAMGLDLSEGTALLATAIGRVAHQADVGTTTGAVLENPPRVGVGMPVIDPDRPANSYLLYKLVVGPQNFQRSADDPDTCTSDYRVGLGDECLPPSADEIQRLREWFVRGEPMPLDGKPVYRSRMQAIERWIRAGAACE